MAEIIEITANPKTLVEINNVFPYIKSIAKEVIDLNTEINEWANGFITSCVGLGTKEVEEKLNNKFKNNRLMNKKMDELTDCLTEMASYGAIIDLTVEPVEIRFSLVDNSIIAYAAWFAGQENITVYEKSTGVPM